LGRMAKNLLELQGFSICQAVILLSCRHPHISLILLDSHCSAIELCLAIGEPAAVVNLKMGDLQELGGCFEIKIGLRLRLTRPLDLWI